MRGVNDRIVLAWRRCNASKLGSVNDNVTEERGVAPLAGPLVLYICAATIFRDITLFQTKKMIGFFLVSVCCRAENAEGNIFDDIFTNYNREIRPTR